MDIDLRVGSVISEAWSILKKNAKFLLLSALGLFVINFLVSMIAGAANDGSGLQVFSSVLQFIISLYVGVAVLVVGLKAARHDTLTFKVWKITDLELLKRYFLTSLVYGLIVAGGMILLVVPGIIWGIMYSQALYIAIDQGKGVRESLKASKDLTRGFKGKIFLIGLVMALISIIGAIPLGLGVIITMPLSMLTGAVVYLRLSEERQPEDRKEEKKHVTDAETKPAVSPMNSYQI